MKICSDFGVITVLQTPGSRCWWTYVVFSKFLKQEKLLFGGLSSDSTSCLKSMAAQVSYFTPCQLITPNK